MNGVLFFTCLWSAFILFFDVITGRGLWLQFESSHYPYVMGQVIYGEVTTHHSSKGGTSYGVNIRYHYVVNDQPFDGSRFRYMSESSDFSWAITIVNAHPVGSQIKVYFNPSDPRDSLLSPDLDGGDLMVLLFLMPFNLTMVGLMTASGSVLRARILKPEAGGVKIIVDGPRTNVRLPVYSALAWSMFAMGMLSFVSIFALGFASHFRPPITACLSVLCLVLVAGAGVYVWQWRKINSGDDDLILDETSATIALPETYGRKQRVTVNRRDIEKLTVEVIEHRGSKGGISYTYAPTLWLRRNERIETEKLADWSDKERAESFAAWLRQRLSLEEQAKVTD